MLARPKKLDQAVATERKADSDLLKSIAVAFRCKDGYVKWETGHQVSRDSRTHVIWD